MHRQGVPPVHDLRPGTDHDPAGSRMAGAGGCHHRVGGRWSPVGSGAEGGPAHSLVTEPAPCHRVRETIRGQPGRSASTYSAALFIAKKTDLNEPQYLPAEFCDRGGKGSP